MIQHSNMGIFRWSFTKRRIETANQVSLDEGNTDLRKIDGIFFKCEYGNPTGSIKDRGVAFQISGLKQKAIKKAVIASSGNAAISSANYCQPAGIDLTIFVPKKININKLRKLSALKVKTVSTETPVKDSINFSKKEKAYNLRHSRDDSVLYGYETIAYELIEENIKPDAIFIPVSSGSAMEGIYRGFARRKVNPPSFHLVQTEHVHPVASIYDKDFKQKNNSLADGIVARVTPREMKLIEIINKTKGSGWVVSDSDIKKAHCFLKEKGLLSGYEGASALSALWKARKKGYKFKTPVCILTGMFY